MNYITAKTIVQKNKSSAWFGADYNMNIYRGCCHGCIYCDSRSECYRNTDFDNVKAKADSSKIIRDDLRRKVRSGIVATGAMSDPYNPFEKELRLTRNALELISAYGFGVAVDTKSPLATRDIDIFEEISRHSPVLVKFTITTASDKLAKIIEPNVAPSSERFNAIAKFSSAGIPVGVLMTPVLPFITDSAENISSLIKTAAESGAKFVFTYLGVTLRDIQREHYYQMLDRHFPGIKDKYLHTYGSRYNCTVPNYKALKKLFVEECEKHGLLYKMEDIVALYKTGYENSQLSFF